MFRVLAAFSGAASYYKKHGNVCSITRISLREQLRVMLTTRDPTPFNTAEYGFNMSEVRNAHGSVKKLKLKSNNPTISSSSSSSSSSRPTNRNPDLSFLDNYIDPEPLQPDNRGNATNHYASTLRNKHY